MPRPVAPLLALSIAIAGLAIAAPAHAKPMNGMVGIGLEQSLGGVTGMTLRYWPMDEFGLSATVGATILIPPTGDNSRGVGTNIVVSAGGTFIFSESTHANFGVGLRGAVGFTNDDFQQAISGDPDGSGLPQFMLEIPLVAEFFLSDNFSISVSTGILLSFVPEPDEGETVKPGGPIPGVNIGIGTGTVSGTIGAVYYF